MSENVTARETFREHESRFGTHGLPVSQIEWRSARDRVDVLERAHRRQTVNRSGPPGVPVDGRARLAPAARAKGLRLTTEAPRKALAVALGEGSCGQAAFRLPFASREYRDAKRRGGRR